jgi:NhaP-type Na+/H+ or K+/H+ antiporter
MPDHLEFMIFGLLVAVTGLVLLSQILRVPYPVFLVVGGLVLSLIPGLPEIELPPDLVFVIFLPPLLYSAAFFTSPRDLKANLRPIALLSIGLVLFTTGAVAVVAHAVIGLPWMVAFVLGVIVSPTDPLAVSVIAGRLGIPRRVVTILEGESLINDGTALTLYRTAVTAVVAGTFSFFDAGLELVLSGIGGIAIGLLVGDLARAAMDRVRVLGDYCCVVYRLRCLPSGRRARRLGGALRGRGGSLSQLAITQNDLPA